MDQKNLHTIIYYFLKGILTREKEEELLSWINSDENNRRLFLQEQARVSGKMVSNKDKTLDKNWKLLQQRVGIGKVEVKVVTLVKRIWPVAAAFIVGILLTVAMVYQFPPEDDLTAHIQNVTTPRGARTHLTLPDGSRVWLNAGTTISYSSVFGKTRQVALEGEAYFEVEKDRKPFAVSTEKGLVTVKGTSFNVKAFADEDLFETTLVEGSVVVRDQGDTEEVVLNPGQQAVIEEGVLRVRNVEHRFFTSWREGKLIFSKEPFPELVKRLERWYNVTIAYNDPRLDELWYTGTIEMETISEVMEMISKAAPVSYSFDNKTRIFTIQHKRNKPIK
jgi:transmembrane sensor